jgi:mannitol-1-phosphate 5-dehydrogenase
LAGGLRKKAAQQGPRAVVYAAENHNHAAEILQSGVMAEVPPAERDAVSARVCFLDTVIGKMSGLVGSPEEIEALGLAPITPTAHPASRAGAFLVEAFNRILVSRVRFADGAPFRRGIDVFEEKAALLPFEEAKLYGHNATHALAAYLGVMQGLRRIADLRDVPGIMSFLRAAFVEESGRALVHRHRGLDPLFTPEGYAHYADDLLARMTNPYLHDTVERVGRDPERKLSWDDRLIGTMRVALGQGIVPQRYALGAAAALCTIDPAIAAGEAELAARLDPLWREASPAEEERASVLKHLWEACRRLEAWRQAGFPPLET